MYENSIQDLQVVIEVQSAEIKELEKINKEYNSLEKDFRGKLEMIQDKYLEEINRINKQKDK